MKCQYENKCWKHKTYLNLYAQLCGHHNTYAKLMICTIFSIVLHKILTL